MSCAALRWLAHADGRRCLLHLLHVHLKAFLERVWRIEHDPIARLEALQHFEGGAVVAANGKRL